MASPNIPPLQFFYATGEQVGFDLTNYLVVNGGGNVLQVRSTGAQSGDRPGLSGRIFPSLQSAWAQCRANKGDVVVALEGHVETVSATNWMSGCPDGVATIGQGMGPAQAQINFTAAASNLGSAAGALALNGCVIAGFNIDMNATAAVLTTAPVLVTGTDNAFVGNRIKFSTSATQQATAPFTVSTGAHRFLFANNKFYDSDGTYATNPTNGILVSAAVNQFTCINNQLSMATNATGTGVLQFSAAALDAVVQGNYFANNKAASTAAVVGFAGVTGYARGNTLTIQAATGGATAWATIGSINLDRNYGTALGGAGHTAILIGTASS